MSVGLGGSDQQKNCISSDEESMVNFPEQKEWINWRPWVGSQKSWCFRIYGITRVSVVGSRYLCGTKWSYDLCWPFCSGDIYFELRRALRKFRVKSDNFLFGTLAWVTLQMFGRTSGSVQGAKRVDVREGIRSVVEGEVSGCILSCCWPLKSIFF